MNGINVMIIDIESELNIETDDEIDELNIDQGYDEYNENENNEYWNR